MGGVGKARRLSALSVHFGVMLCKAEEKPSFLQNTMGKIIAKGESVMLRFVQKVQGDVPQELVQEGIASRLAQLLYARGIDSVAAAQKYLKPQKEHLHDPMLLQNMDKAIACMRDAIAKEEEITVFGDYDVDGVSATAILVTYLKKCGAKTNYYIPDRHGEGYGLNKEAIARVAKTSKLLITVDCGITCVEEVAYAQELGMRVIVTDHHQLPPQLPQCEAIINPLMGEYPFRKLCGAGVAFKIVQAMGGLEALAPFWELAALATVADIVPLMDENRVIVYYGLQEINKTTRPGLLALIETAGLTGNTITSGHIGFQIAPRINAGGRLALASRSVELLTTRSMETARDIALALEGENTQRRAIELEIFNAADAMVKEQVDFQRDRAIVLCAPGWNPGVIGLAASRLVEKYRWPTILLSRDGEVCVGSARSILGVNIHAALSACGADMFVRFGGHAQAAGMTLRAEKMDEFRDTLNRILRIQVPPETYLPVEEFDLELELSEVDEPLVKSFEAMQPTGFGNPTPLFCLRGVAPMDTRKVGKEGAHLKLRLISGEEACDAIAFRQGELCGHLPGKVDVLFSPGVNEFRDVRTVQCEVRKMIPFSPSRAFLETCVAQEETFPLALLEGLQAQDAKPEEGVSARGEGFMKVESLVREALSADIQGTVLLAHTLSGVKKWLTHLAVMGAQIDYMLGFCTDVRGFNTLIARPEVDKLPVETKQIFLLDGTVGEGELAALARQCPQAQITYVTDMPQFLQNTAKEAAVTDEELRSVYKQLRTARDEALLAEGIAKALGLRVAQVHCALAVFEELSLITWTRMPWKVHLLPMQKCDLNDSRVLCALRALASGK